MSSLIAIIYPSEDKAEEVRKRLIELQKEYLVGPEQRLDH